MALARRLVLRLETGSGKSLFAERGGHNNKADRKWVIGLPGGGSATAYGMVVDCIAEMKQIAEEEYGGAGRLWARSEEGGWEPYAPGCYGPKAAELRRAKAANDERAA